MACGTQKKFQKEPSLPIPGMIVSQKKGMKLQCATLLRLLPVVRSPLLGVRSSGPLAPASCLTPMLEEAPTAVTISPDLEAQILRYYHVEKWRVGTSPSAS